MTGPFRKNFHLLFVALLVLQGCFSSNKSILPKNYVRPIPVPPASVEVNLDVLDSMGVADPDAANPAFRVPTKKQAYVAPRPPARPQKAAFVPKSPKPKKVINLPSQENVLKYTPPDMFSTKPQTDVSASSLPAVPAEDVMTEELTPNPAIPKNPKRRPEIQTYVIEPSNPKAQSMDKAAVNKRVDTEMKGKNVAPPHKRPKNNGSGVPSTLEEGDLVEPSVEEIMESIEGAR